KFGVHTVCPGKDVLRELKASGEEVTPETLKQWLDRPVRYVWGFPGQPAVAAIEVYPPVSAQLQLSFVGVHNLVVSCIANVPKGGEDRLGSRHVEVDFIWLNNETAGNELPLSYLLSHQPKNAMRCAQQEDGRGYPDPPNGLHLAQLCFSILQLASGNKSSQASREVLPECNRYVKTPDALSLDGHVTSDISLTGFGWVAVSFSAMNSQALVWQLAGQCSDQKSPSVASLTWSKQMGSEVPEEFGVVMGRGVFGPKRLKVVQNELPGLEKCDRFPMPVAGLPGIVPAPPEVGLEDEDAEEAIAAEEADSIDPETPTVVEVPSQPWAEDLGRSVGGFTRSAPGGGTTGADKDDEAAAEAVKPKLPE
ncbi:unnamed protein product, partial [Symbiodinium microadriaticum]